MNLLLGITGSVAAIKTPDILKHLKDKAKERKIDLNIHIIATRHALSFLPEEVRTLYIPMSIDDDEWREWKIKGDKVLHIELRRWAHILAIVPLDANTLAKIANGICDNLLTCVARAWPVGNMPMIVFPAMNTMMWEHPLTARQLAVLNDFGIQTVNPVEKTLACGDFGMGGLPSPDVVANCILEIISTVKPT